MKRNGTCESCLKNKSSGVSAIVNSVYYRQICSDCLTRARQVSSGYARWSRGIDLEDHEHEIMQPYNADGTINTRFAKLYPKQAKTLYTDGELRDANRN